MRRIGMNVINEKKTALTQDSKTGSTTQGRDLLTLLIKSNMAYENEGQMMTDDEVLGRMYRTTRPATNFKTHLTYRCSAQKFQPF
jgi:hypothetical protein